MPDNAAGGTPTTRWSRWSRRPAGLVASIAVLLALVAGVATAAPNQDASPQPGGERPQWAMDTNDLFRGFERSDYNEQDGSPRQMTAPDGEQGLQFQLEPGDQRSELEPDMPNQTEGQVQWYTYRAQLADNFPVGVESWQVVLQWHHEGSSGSPPIAVEVRNGRLEVAAEGENFQDLGPVAAGEEINLTMRILFSRDTSRGTVDVWRDGQHALQGFRPPGGTLLDDYNYLKVGYYRDDGIDDFGRLWLHDLRAGPTLASVSDGDDSPAAQVPPAEDPDVAPPAATGPVDETSNTLPWIGGGLLLVLVVAGAALLARRRQRQ